MNIKIIACSLKGYELGQKIAEKYGCTVESGSKITSEKLNIPFVNHYEWTNKNFENSDALIFIGAVGIAVRSVGKLLKSKLTDPAVICIDDCGKFTIPILSGHVGGANKLALEISDYINSIPVVTTATDINNVFAIDSWAVSQGLKIRRAYKIKEVSGKLLHGENIVIKTEVSIVGNPPKGVKVIDLTENCDFDVIITSNADEKSDSLMLLWDKKNDKISF